MQSNGKRYTLGILIDWIVSWGDSPYYQSLIVSGLSDFARENDVNVMCFVTGRVDSPNDWERCRNLIFKFVDENKVDGLIVPVPAIALYGNAAPVFKFLESYRDLPIVTVSESPEEYHSVTIDNYPGMRQVVDHLIDNHGYKRIAFIKGPPCKESNVRFQAYCDSLSAHGIALDPELLYTGNFLYDSGTEAIKAFRQKNVQYDALVCSNDNMAMGAIIEYNRNNENPRFTLPVTGFDDMEAGKTYGLTTVRQSFNDQTRRAAEMLMCLIQGKETPVNVEIPTTVVLRSSCGCISDLVKNTYYGTAAMNTAPLIEQEKQKILSELLELNKTLDFAGDFREDLLQFEAKVLDAFYEEYENGIRDIFVSAVDKLIHWTLQSRLSYLFTQDVVSIIRRNILDRLTDRADIIRAENIFHAARVQAFDELHHAGLNRLYYNPVQSESTEQLGEDLMSSLDYASQMKAVCRVLPMLRIHTCYIALFEDPMKPLDQSRLILGMTENQCYNNGAAGFQFRTLDLLPEAFWSELCRKRFNIVIQALHQGGNPIGYVILDFDNTINKNHEIIRYRLSVSLKGTMLIDNISKQAANLEREVIERTKELSDTNRNLLEEVAKRKSVEEKLKQALRDLGYYNEQLHRLSIRDDLTQLYNRRGFMKLGTEYYENAKDNLIGFLLLYADVDGLKKINDKYGHNEGDNAISATASILNKTFRNSDTISRLGGDEFTVLISGAAPRDEADIRKRINYYCDLYNSTSGKPYKLSMSVGAAFYTPARNETFEDLMKAADAALYRDKQSKLGLPEKKN